MPFIPVPNTVEIVPQFLVDGQRCANVHHVDKGSAWTVADMEAVAAAYIDWWNTNVRPGLVSNLVSLNSVIVRDLTTSSSPAIEYAVGLPLFGAVANGLPNHVTVAIKWVTALRGRSFRGRTYHIGLAEGHVADNQVTVPNQTALLNNYELLRDALEGTPAGGDMVVVSKFTNGAPRVTGVTTPITAVAVDPVVDSQRRRLPGRGE